MVRAFLGGARDPNVLSKTDDELARAALTDLTTILDIRGLPTLTRVYRWSRSSPQQEVGHADLMKRIDSTLARHPGLFVSAAGFRGVGIPDCIADARSTAATAATFVRE
jgi:oxygen-dependent protoporphyrinogen oxidase